MTTLATLLAATTLAAPLAADPKVTEVSMFKNGFAIVVREIDVPRPGNFAIDRIPNASLGTLWFSTTEGLQLSEIVATSTEQTTEAHLGSLAEVLEANVGKVLAITVVGLGPTPQVLKGTLRSAAGTMVVIESDQTRFVPKNSVVSVAAANGRLLLKRSTTAEVRSLRLTAQGRPGKVRMVSIERGVSWVPGYAVDISDEKELTLTAKATVLNDLEPLKFVEARFITGFPNLTFAHVPEPLTSGQTLDQFLGLLGSGAAPKMGGRLAEQMVNQAGAFGSPGGFGGFNDAMPVNPVPGEQAEDLFFYRRPGVTLKRGDRAHYILFSMQAPYEKIATWDIDDQVVNNVEYRPQPLTPEQPVVWNTLRFKNTSGQPLTTAAGTTTANGRPLGQDILRYVPSGGEATLRITQALDVRAEAREEEVSRERGAIKRADGYPLFDLVNVKGILRVRNMKGEAVKMRVQKRLTGEVVSPGEGGTVERTTAGLQDTNPKAVIRWEPSIAAGKEWTLEYTYKLYVRSP